MSRKITAVLALIAVVLLSACNQPKSMLARAIGLRDAGKTDEALGLLGEIKEKYPEAPETSEAGSLAASWLVEDANNVESKNEKKALLVSALDWDPNSGAAQAGLCQIKLAAHDYEGLRGCLRDLDGRTGAPEAGAASMKKELDARDEREKWKGSSEPTDWLRLVKKYPSSGQAREVKPKVLAHFTICGADFKRTALQDALAVTDEEDAVVAFWARMADRELDQISSYVTFAKGMRVIVSRQKENQGKLAKTRESIETHPCLSDEVDAKKKLAQFYTGLESISKRWVSLEPYTDGRINQGIFERVVAVKRANTADAERLVPLRSSVTIDTCPGIINEQNRSEVISRIVKMNLGE